MKLVRKMTEACPQLDRPRTGAGQPGTRLKSLVGQLRGVARAPKLALNFVMRESKS
jgi:hypothetical protein